jgi:hypothetical protein
MDVLYVIFKQRKNGECMRNKKTWVTITVLVLLLSGCFSELLISDVIFKYHCKKNIEFSVYETAGLNEEYVIDIPKDVRKRDARFNVSKNKMLDKERITNNYNIEFYKKNKISTVGPVESITTTIVRKRDKKVMGKVVSFEKTMGWIDGLSGDAPVSRHCPAHENKKVKSISGNFHKQLVSKIFILN